MSQLEDALRAALDACTKSMPDGYSLVSFKNETRHEYEFVIRRALKNGEFTQYVWVLTYDNLVENPLACVSYLYTWVKTVVGEINVDVPPFSVWLHPVEHPAKVHSPDTRIKPVAAVKIIDTPSDDERTRLITFED